MTLIRTDSGNKVGWATYDNEAEATAHAEAIAAPGGPRDKALAAGYDFGYCWPGTIERGRRYISCRLCHGTRHDHMTDHEFAPDASGAWEWIDEWTVTTP